MYQLLVHCRIHDDVIFTVLLAQLWTWDFAEEGGIDLKINYAIVHLVKLKIQQKVAISSDNVKQCLWNLNPLELHGQLYCVILFWLSCGGLHFLATVFYWRYWRMFTRFCSGFMTQFLPPWDCASVLPKMHPVWRPTDTILYSGNPCTRRKMISMATTYI